MTDAHARGKPEYGWLLDRLITDVPGARCAVLLASDGLATAFSGLDKDGADQMAAITAGLLSTARAAGATFGRGAAPEVRQVLVELAEDLLFVSSAGEGSVLALLADREASPRVAGQQIAQFVGALRAHLATPARLPAP